MTVAASDPVPEYPNLPEMLLTRFDEGSFVTMGAIVKRQDRYYIVAVWRNRNAPASIPWQLPTPDYLARLKRAEPYQELMKFDNIQESDVLTPDESVMAELLKPWSTEKLPSIH